MVLDTVFATREEIDKAGRKKKEEIIVPGDEENGIVIAEERTPFVTDGPDSKARKYYFDGGQVEIVAHLLYEIDSEGNQLRVRELTEYTAEKVRSLSPNAEILRRMWADPGQRTEIIKQLEDRGIDFHELAEKMRMQDADPFDLLR